MAARDNIAGKSGRRVEQRHLVLIASSNEGKLAEYRKLAIGSSLDIELLPNFRALPPFDESMPTFAENSAGKALHYSEYSTEMVLTEDSGLVVPVLGGAPGVHSARYAGPNATDADRNLKLLEEIRGKSGEDRRARFICVTTIARKGQTMVIISDLVDGSIAEEPRGGEGFGYDPIFVLPGLDRTFAQISGEEKNLYSHRGRAFRKVLKYFSLQNNTTIS